MRLFPAIDLFQGKAVRLFQGDYDQMTVYSDDPVGVAKHFQSLGANSLHLVDLEGAKLGTTSNFPVIRRMTYLRKWAAVFGVWKLWRLIFPWV